MAQTVTVVPYDATIDRESDKLLPWLWQKLQKDDLVDLYFPGQTDTGFAAFVHLLSGEGSTHSALLVTDDKSGQWDKTVAGFITWQPMPLGAANSIVAGFIFYREFWDHRVTLAAAEAAFKFWFDGMKIDMVLGVCPALHRTAMLYNQRVGLREVGRLPKCHLYKEQPCDAVLYALTREQWKGGA